MALPHLRRVHVGSTDHIKRYTHSGERHTEFGGVVLVDAACQERNSRGNWRDVHIAKGPLIVVNNRRAGTRTLLLWNETILLRMSQLPAWGVSICCGSLRPHATLAFLRSNQNYLIMLRNRSARSAKDLTSTTSFFQQEVFRPRLGIWNLERAIDPVGAWS